VSSKPCVAGKSRKHEVLVRGNVHVVAEALPVEPAVPAHRLVHERGGGSVRRPGGDRRGGRPLMVSRRHCFVCGKTKRVVLAQLGGELLHWTPHCVIRRASKVVGVLKWKLGWCCPRTMTRGRAH